MLSKDFVEEVILVLDLTLRCQLVTSRWRCPVKKLGMQTVAQHIRAGHTAGHVVIYIEVIVRAILLDVDMLNSLENFRTIKSKNHNLNLMSRIYIFFYRSLNNYSYLLL